MADYLLAEAKIAVVPGGAFESPDNIRIAYSTHGKPDRRYEPYGSSFKETWLI